MRQAGLRSAVATFPRFGAEEQNMLNIPVKNPVTAQLITIGAGIAVVLVAHFAPNYAGLLRDILNVIGIGAIGVGGASFTAKTPADAQPVAPRDHIRFDDVTPTDPPTAALSVWNNKWPIVGCCVALLSCSNPPPAKAPCDETTVALMTKECTEQAFACGLRGIPKNECPAIAACNAQLDARKKECSQ